MRVYEDLKEMLCKELEEISRKGELTAGTLDTVDKLTHAIKSIETIMAMNEYEDGYSSDGMSNARRDNMRSRRSYEHDGVSYARGRTGNVRRDRMGRYSRGDYSYDEAKDDMMSELHELMNSAPDEETKKEFKRFMSKLETM